MKELTIARDGLVKIVSEDVTFKKVLKLLFPRNSQDKKYLSIVSSLLGCELRHHLLFTELLKKEENLTIEEESLIRLALANHLFLRKLDEEKVLQFLKENLNEKYSDNLKKLLAFQGQVSEIIDIDHSSIEYISLRFNSPTWLIKMWNKHYGKGLTFKTLKANCAPSQNYYRIDTKLKKEAPFSDESKFLPTEVSDVYKYVDKESLKKLPAYQNGSIFLIKSEVKAILDKYYNPLLNECLLYSGEDDAIVKEFYLRSEGKTGINLVVPDISKRAEILRLIRVNNIKNINLFMANDPVGYQTGISHPQELVFVYPTSSSFSRIQMYPDYLLHFKKDSFDELIKKQKEVLYDLSKFVLPGGTLIYMVDTLNKKESSSIVTNFLLDNTSFSLVEELQLFPFENGNSTLYYAVMKKADND